MTRLLPIAFSLIAGLTAANAEPAALLIGNEDYSNFRDVIRGDEILNLEGPLERAGVQVTTRRSAILANMQTGMEEFERNATTAETLLVGLGGRFVHTESETYYLPPGAVVGPVGTLAWRSLPMSTVMAWLAERPGKSILLLGTDGLRQDIGTYLRTGIGELDIPQGVTVVAGDTRALSNFAAETIARPGRTFVDAARSRGLVVLGYDPEDLVHLEQAVVAQTSSTSEVSRTRDIFEWRQASETNTVEAYQNYLRLVPDGRFARMAEARIFSLTDTPEARAERAEQALDLSRDARRVVQRNLTLLGYDTRGIDGIFGNGTRSALSSWQGDQNINGYGYLTEEQIARLDSQAQQRATQLAREAEQRRLQLQAEDRSYWAQTGSKGTEQGLRDYLRRYPDGEFANAAATRLDQLEQQKLRQTNSRDRDLWDRAVATNTIRAYRDYLQLSPNGAFREGAEARIARIQRRREAVNSEAAKAEEAMSLSAGTRRLIEARLNTMGLEPGAVDGQFDDETRRAIRRYQRSNEMRQTGYLTERMVVQLMAGAVRQIFQ